MKDLFLVGRAIGFIECGRSIAFVARHLNVSRTSVRRWLREFRNSGHVARRKSPGRPHVTTPRSNRLLGRIARFQRFCSAPMLLQLWGERVSSSTLRRRMKALGYRQYRAALKPFLSEANRQARYRWCQNHVFWPPLRFQRVIWTDESRFRLLINDGRVRVWRQRGERYRQDLQKRAMQGGGGSVHVWGAVWHDGRSVLQILHQTVNGELYCRVLREFLGGDRLPEAPWTLQQDNAPAHRSALVQAFLAERAIRHLDWPSRSPDLNPIEHVWDFLGKKVQAARPQSLRHLADSLVLEWNRMPQDFVNNLVASMPRRITAVLEANGGTTRY